MGYVVEDGNRTVYYIEYHAINGYNTDVCNTFNTSLYFKVASHKKFVRLIINTFLVSYSCRLVIKTKWCTLSYNYKESFIVVHLNTPHIN